MNEEKIDLIPDAHLLLSSLRSVGYKVETAVADIIDNCISAHADEIHIDFIWNDVESSIYIYDNGEGMSKPDLISAMKIGSADPNVIRSIDDLGRFGMGMKTAAFSLGKRLTVYSKNKGEISSACWDLEYIEQRHDGNWTLTVEQEDSEKHLAVFEAGTVVKIDNLDRLIDENSLKKSKINFFNTMEKVKSHTSLIFHRFIEEDGLKIYFGEELTEAWNPFILNNAATQELSEENIEGDKPVYIQPYVLPHKTKFNSEEEYKLAQGYRGWNAHQGFYVYRNRRLLVYGTWFDFLKKEPAFNLASVSMGAEFNDENEEEE